MHIIVTILVCLYIHVIYWYIRTHMLPQVVRNTYAEELTEMLTGIEIKIPNDSPQSSLLAGMTAEARDSSHIVCAGQ